MLGDGVGLRQLPACADVDDGLDDGVTLLVHECERRALVGHGEGELALVHQADFFYLRGVIDIIQEDGLAKYTGPLCRGHLDCCGAHLMITKTHRASETWCLLESVDRSNNFLSLQPQSALRSKGKKDLEQVKDIQRQHLAGHRAHKIGILCESLGQLLL